MKKRALTPMKKTVFKKENMDKRERKRGPKEVVTSPRRLKKMIFFLLQEILKQLRPKKIGFRGTQKRKRKRKETNGEKKRKEKRRKKKKHEER